MQYVPFTVLMPLYNHERDLPRAIESVLKQKTDFQYRLLIIDDKSTDNSLAVAKKYQAENPDRIEIIENEKNLGLLGSITRVYADLNCDYFAVLDPDDYYTVDDKFQRALSFLEQHPDFTCYFANVLTVYPDGKKKPWIRRRKSCDFDFQDYKKGKGAIPQTSGGIFRNIIFRNSLPEKFSAAVHSPHGQVLRADSFRSVAHLHEGKAHFENRLESVYSYNQKGIWSRLKEWEQFLSIIELYIVLSDYFEDEAGFFIRSARNYYNGTISRIVFEMITLRDFPTIKQLERLLEYGEYLQKADTRQIKSKLSYKEKFARFTYKLLGIILRKN